jgi:hypothetical protein
MGNDKINNSIEHFIHLQTIILTIMILTL